jgi:hypothetical protein
MSKVIIDDTVDNQDLSHLYKYVEWHNRGREYLLKPAGLEHYKLLSHISKQLPDGAIIVDIGTYFGASALALSTNPNVKVITYDLFYWLPIGKTGERSGVLTVVERADSVLDVSNIFVRMYNCLKEPEELKRAHVIMLDIDPHDGGQEIDIMEELARIGYRGLVICDDIHLNENMLKFWKWVPQKKINVTQVAHSTGTGIVVFDPSFIDVDYTVNSST